MAKPRERISLRISSAFSSSVISQTTFSLLSFSFFSSKSRPVMSRTVFMYSFEIFLLSVSPQGVDHGKGKKLSLDEIFLIFFPKISSHYPIGEFGGRIRHGNKNFFSLPLIAKKFEVWHPLIFYFWGLPSGVSSRFPFAEFFWNFPALFQKNFQESIKK